MPAAMKKDHLEDSYMIPPHPQPSISGICGGSCLPQHGETPLNPSPTLGVFYSSFKSADSNLGFTSSIGIWPNQYFFSMKSVEMLKGKMHNFGADDGNTVFLSDLTSVTTTSLSDKDGTYNAPGYGFNVSLGSPVIVVIFGMLSFIFFIGFLILLLCRRTTFVERTRSFRRQVTNNNGRGLERSVIESFPVFSYNLVKGLKAQATGSECAVCLSDFGDEEMVRLLPKCNHAFHPECIDMWLSSHTTCPVCRISLTPAEDSTPTATPEPRTTPEQVAIVVDNDNNEGTQGAPETSHDSTGHSLVRVGTELEQGTEWFISTPAGLKPGLRKSFSYAGHRRFQKPRDFNAPPKEAKPGVCEGDAGHRSRSERLGESSKNLALFIRSFSERVPPQPREQRDR